MNKHETINYLEIPSTDLNLTKEFFSKVFAWEFTEHGSDYISFSHSNIEGGFFTSPKKVQSKEGSVLIVFYSETLELTYNKILKANGKIIQDTFNFPGGRRFHFEDLTGNEYAVWSNK
jgi:predicted enzyme related to lactoylglutathione lyase